MKSKGMLRAASIALIVSTVVTLSGCEAPPSRTAVEIRSTSEAHAAKPQPPNAKRFPHVIRDAMSYLSSRTSLPLMAPTSLFTQAELGNGKYLAATVHGNRSGQEAVFRF